jgi:hypothetical protein
MLVKSRRSDGPDSTETEARLHEHKVGRISVQTVAGCIPMHAESKVFDLPAGHLLALERALPAQCRGFGGVRSVEPFVCLTALKKASATVVLQ